MVDWDGIDYVFWPAAVRKYAFREQVAAAVAGGFTSLAIAPNTVRDTMRTGMSFAAIRAYAADRGVPLSYLDSLTSWTPNWFASDFDAHMRDRHEFSVGQALEMCSELGLRGILAVAGYDKNSLNQDVLIEGFQNLCSRADKIGVRVDLEFMPFWGLPDLASAWAIVGPAQCPNAGITVDTWHFSKGNPDFDLLKRLPGELFVSVQVNDGFKRQVSGSLFEDTIRYRKFPGEGDLPTVEILKILNAKGHLRSIGPEVFSDEANAMTPEEAGRKCASTLRNVLDIAGISLPESPDILKRY